MIASTLPPAEADAEAGAYEDAIAELGEYDARLKYVGAIWESSKRYATRSVLRSGGGHPGAPTCENAEESEVER